MRPDSGRSNDGDPRSGSVGHKPSTLALITGHAGGIRSAQAVEGRFVAAEALGRGTLRGGGHLNFPAVGFTTWPKASRRLGSVTFSINVAAVVYLLIF